MGRVRTKKTKNLYVTKGRFNLKNMKRTDLSKNGQARVKKNRMGLLKN